MRGEERPWPSKCPECGREIEEIRRYEARGTLECPVLPVDVPCPMTLRLGPQEFRLALARAKNGRSHLFQDVWIRREHI